MESLKASFVAAFAEWLYSSVKTWLGIYSTVIFRKKIRFDFLEIG